MDSKICSKCNEDKKLAEYNWRNKPRGWRHSFCKNCHSKYRASHYLNNRDKYIKKAKSWNKKQTEILRKFILNYLLTHPCVDCGEGDIRVLDFDHRANKFMIVSNMVRNCHSLSAVEEEIKKCLIRCANCHRKRTFTAGNYWKIKMGP